jgi:hypothetical protein
MKRKSIAAAGFFLVLYACGGRVESNGTGASANPSATGGPTNGHAPNEHAPNESAPGSDPSSGGACTISIAEGCAAGPNAEAPDGGPPNWWGHCEMSQTTADTAAPWCSSDNPLADATVTRCQQYVAIVYTSGDGGETWFYYDYSGQLVAAFRDNGDESACFAGQSNFVRPPKNECAGWAGNDLCDP